MENTDKIKKLAEMKRDNPEKFNRLVKENLAKNPDFGRLMDSLPIEEKCRRDNLTWLDRQLMKEEELTEEEVLELHPAEKVELYLKLQGIVGYGNNIIKAVSAAYGVELNL